VIGVPPLLIASIFFALVPDEYETRFEKIETIEVGGVSIDLCRREDGVFGLGEVRQGGLPLRRADFLVTWQVGGRFPAFEGRKGPEVRLRDPRATLTFRPQRRECAGTVL